MIEVLKTLQSMHSDLVLMSQAFKQYIGLQAEDKSSAASSATESSSKPQARSYRSLSPNRSFCEVVPVDVADGGKGDQKGGRRVSIQKRVGLGSLTMRLTKRGRKAKAKSGPPAISSA